MLLLPDKQLRIQGNMQILPIADPDIPAVARLLKELAEQFIVHESPPEGAATFLRENDETGIRGFVASGHVYHVAIVDGELAGFIAVRERKHLFHMFVGAKWQRQGIAGKLWKVARRGAMDAGGAGDFTVNSSNFAVPVYEAMGFVRTAPMQCAKGLYFNPMASLGRSESPIDADPRRPCATTGCLPSP